MPAGIDLIEFDNSEDWQVVADRTVRATQITEDDYIPIGAFTLGLSLNTDYVAVVATTGSGRDTWQFAGDISQVYRFIPGGSNPITRTIQPVRTRILLNKLTLIETNRISTDSFDLRYQPPYWFRDCAIRVYAYSGEALNFVEDSLFAIGNALGVDNNRQDGRIIEALLALKLQLDNQTEVLQERLDETNVATEEVQQRLLEQVNELDAGVYTIAEAIAELLPPGQAQELVQNTQRRLNLDLGYL